MQNLIKIKFYAKSYSISFDSETVLTFWTSLVLFLFNNTGLFRSICFTITSEEYFITEIILKTDLRKYFVIRCNKLSPNLFYRSGGFHIMFSLTLPTVKNNFISLFPHTLQYFNVFLSSTQKIYDSYFTLLRLSYYHFICLDITSFSLLGNIKLHNDGNFPILFICPHKPNCFSSRTKNIECIQNTFLFK